MTNVTELIHKLLEEKAKIEMSALIGKEIDYSNLREAAKNLKETSNELFPFNIEGNDAELMLSVIETEKKFRP